MSALGLGGHKQTGAGRLSAREGYRLWAASYDDDPNPLLALEERELERMLPDTREMDAIDLGCGTGRWLRKLLKRGVRSAIGVDLSDSMVARGAAKTHLRHRLVLGDCLSLPFREQTADLVICSFTLEHILDLDTLAREVRRISRPAAQLFLSHLHPQAEAQGWRCAFRHEGRSLEIEGFDHTIRTVQEAFRAAGFTLRRSADLTVGEPERPIFTRGAKEAMFDEASAVPAVAVHHLWLPDAPIN